MAAYNAEGTVAAAIESVLGQTDQDFELVLVNDGARDGTGRILHAFQRRDPRIVVVDQENIGLTKSLNRAIGLARGRYVVRHDADDRSAPHRLEKIREAAQQGFKFITSQAFFVRGSEQLSVRPRRKNFQSAKRMARSFRFGNFLVHGTFAFERGLIQSQKYDESFRYAQDYELALRLLAAGHAAHLIEQPLYYLEKGAGTLSATKKVEQDFCAKAICEKYFGSSRDQLLGKGPLRAGWLRVKRELLLALPF